MDVDDHSVSDSRSWRRLEFAPAILLRIAPSFAFAALCLYLIHRQFGDMSLQDVLAAMSAPTAFDFAVAAVFIVLSLLALSCYDLVAFTSVNARAKRQLHAPWPRLLLGGFAGSVTAQSLGLGVLTGAMARAQIYKLNGVSTYRAGALSLAAALGFIGGGLAFISLLAIANPAPVSDLIGISHTGARLAAFAAILMLVLAATIRTGPNGDSNRAIRTLGLFTLFTGLDLTFAALAFGALAPSGAAPDFTTLVTIFAIATVAGHLTGAPAGIGLFEVILLTTLTSVPAESVIATILLYRVLYYGAPLIAALTLIAFAKRSPTHSLAKGAELLDRIDWASDASDNPEAELARLGDKHVYQPLGLQGFMMYGVSGRIWLVLGDPIAPRNEWSALIKGLEAEAKAVGATLAAYKASEAALPYWRTRNHSAVPYGEEAVVDTASFSLEGAHRRELRRKVRSAAKAGMIVHLHYPGDAPLDALSDVADQWRMDKDGPELGFSMGAWRPAFAQRHTILSGWVDDQPVAFISVWISGDGRQWMLDLIRQTDQAPNGAVHALVAQAIQEASAAGATSFNLCMAPLAGLEDAKGMASFLTRAAYARLGAKYGLHGMRRFKTAFRPNWSRRYITAPSALAHLEALLAAHRLVRGQGIKVENNGRVPLVAPSIMNRTHHPATNDETLRERERKRRRRRRRRARAG